MSAWARGKDFFAMLHTLSDFSALPLTQPSTQPLELPARGATPSQLRRAYHRASLRLHPDRLRALPTSRRAEGEELFKALGAALEAECARQAADLTA